jgi:hypothetical protein
LAREGRKARLEAWAAGRPSNLAFFTGVPSLTDMLGQTGLRGRKGLGRRQHGGSSVVYFEAPSRSHRPSRVELRGVGLPDMPIDHLPMLLDRRSVGSRSCSICDRRQDEALARRPRGQPQGRRVRPRDEVLLRCLRHSLTGWRADGETDRAAAPASTCSEAPLGEP